MLGGSSKPAPALGALCLAEKRLVLNGIIDTHNGMLFALHSQPSRFNCILSPPRASLNSAETLNESTTYEDSIHSDGMSSISTTLPRHVRALGRRAWKVIRVNWHLGVTAFGGPPVHFQIVGFLRVRCELSSDSQADLRPSSSTKSLSRKQNGSTSRSFRSCSASPSRSPARRAPRCCIASTSSVMAFRRPC